MGRAPCCDKANVKRGPWSPEEDAKLKSYIDKHGTGGNWIALPEKIGLKRCGKSCRLRWLNYLRPNIKHGGFSEEEDEIICSLYVSLGSRWSIIAAQLPGRTDNDVKNYWNTRLKKKLLGKQQKDYQAGRSKGNATSVKQGSYPEKFMDQQNPIPATTFATDQMIPHWPEMPVGLYSNHQGPSLFNDHASVRKLLFKLGGRISYEDQLIYHDYSTNIPYPFDGISCSMPEIIDQQSVNVTPSSVQLDSQQFVNTGFNTDGIGIGMVQHHGEIGGFPKEMEELKCSRVERLDGGPAALCWEDHSTVNTGTEPSWGEINLLDFS
ncbi:hypothetical protein Nepgr_025048 [Nepenthes gracilis]|uniref:Uncharacterized protein n=1 Tax=Nepenthes gracilis TaxID=150966 RepID=A0AAD3Y0P2_NEPGR|nr:hypothetical protein Nepgr_025048 [Nepenthes gracilis]